MASLLPKLMVFLSDSEHEAAHFRTSFVSPWDAGRFDEIRLSVSEASRSEGCLPMQ